MADQTNFSDEEGLPQEWTEDVLMDILPVLGFDDFTVQDDGLDELRCTLHDLNNLFAA